MKKVLLIPASFKGSLSSSQAAEIMEKAIQSHYPSCEIIKIPISDGGEGLVECFLSFSKGSIVRLKTHGPDKSVIESFYGLFDNDKAVVEVAASAGIMLAKDRQDPALATTLGVGELIKDALERNVKTIFLGLGGSATNDAGCGIAHVLGVRFLDQDRIGFLPTGATLCKIADISTANVDQRIKQTKIICLSDVTNPLYGPNGAARIFAGQKGANQDMIDLLDQNLQYYADLLKRKYGFSSKFPGAGAAGGIPVSMKAFFGSEVKRGISTILEMLDFPDLIKGCDCVISGEGKLDRQSLQGKVISGIASICRSSNIPLYAFAGKIEGLSKTDFPAGLVDAFAINPEGTTLEEAILCAKSALYSAVSQFVSKS